MSHNHDKSNHDWWETDKRLSTARAYFIAAQSSESRLDLHDCEERALKHYKKSAMLGYPPAQNALGYFYTTGKLGTLINYPLALNWFRSAAQAGHSGAMLNLGAMYIDGYTGSVDTEKALNYFVKAAAKGSDEAQSCVQRFSA